KRSASMKWTSCVARTPDILSVGGARACLRFLPEDAARHLPPEQIGADGMYAAAFASLSPIGYNTNLVKPEDARTTFADLLDPRWQGRIVKGNPDYSGTAFTATFALSRDLGWSYFERLAQQKVVQVQSSRDPPNRLARGESAVQADGAHSELDS